MHMIEAIIKPSAIQEANRKLAEQGILGATALECKGYGRQKGHTERYRGGRMDIGFVPKVLLKVAVKSEDLEKATEAIRSSCYTGKVGDGKIFVYQLSNVSRIRTGETDYEAL